MKLKIGEMNILQVRRKSDIGYMLLNEGGADILLPFQQAEGELENSREIEVFIFLDSKKRLVATMRMPYIMVDHPGFVRVTNVKKELGVFIDNNMMKDPLISNDDLPFDYDFWPQVGDEIFCKLKSTATNLIARAISPEEAKEMFKGETTKLNKFDKVEAVCLKNGPQGTNFMTREGHSIFVYYKHRRRNYRIGEVATVTINNCLLDETYNGTVLDHKLRLMKNDADVIIDYLNECDGVMAFTAKSDVEDIEREFKMSKAAFKRALGNLYKQRLIEFIDDKTYLVKK